MIKDALAQEIVHGLAESVQRGGRSLGAVPGLLRRLIDEGLWQQRSVNGEVVTFNKKDFKAFVEAPYPVGISTTLETLEALCGHEPAILEFIARARQGKPGGQIGNTNAARNQVNPQGHVIETNGDNIAIRSKKRPKHGSTSASEVRNRLRSEAYEIDKETGEILAVKNEQIRVLYADVLEGRKAPNAAALEAGFTHPKVAVRLDDLRSAACTLASKLTRDEIDELISELQKHRG